MPPKGDNPTTKKRKVVKDSKGNPVKTGTGGTATSNDYSKSKPKAKAKPAAKKAATKKAPAKAAPAKKTSATRPKSRPETKTTLKRSESESMKFAKAAKSAPKRQAGNKGKTGPSGTKVSSDKKRSR